MAQSCLVTHDMLGQETLARNEDIDRMYSEPLPSTRTGALYNAFSYPTKISPEVVGLFIATHTEPGDSVLDTFSGSGSTGLGALLCDKPTQKMRAMAASLGLSPKWGPREAHLVEIGTLGCFISRVLSSNVSSKEFEKASNDLIDKARRALTGLYSAVDPDGEIGEIRHVLWSEILVCQNCGAESALWDVAARRNPARFLESFSCGTCSYDQKVSHCSRVEITQDDIFGRVVKTRKRVPVDVYGITGRKKWRRPVQDTDGHINGWKSYKLPESAPDVAIRWGDLQRSGYHTGIARLNHFYTPRNFLVISTLIDLANSYPSPIKEVLLYLILSYNSTHSTLMTRIVAKKEQSDFVLTGSQSGVLYVSGLPVEKNIFLGLKRKINVISSALEILNGSRSKVHVHNTSSEKLPISNEVIDYIFTDPPFGDYIPYAEINQINELWLAELTDSSKETIISSSAGKDEDFYQASMSKVFSEIHRVLKKTGLVTVVFHSAKASIWQSLISAYQGANLYVKKTSVLDKIQASFKQVVSNVSVKGDPLILLEKSDHSKCDVTRSIDEVLSSIKIEFEGGESNDVRSFFSRYVSECIAEGLPVSMGASDFEKYLKNKL